MNTPLSPVDRNMIIVFFVYGLAFFSMGLAVWLESGRSSGFRTLRILRLLAGFGILHGVHEWIEVFSRLDDAGLIELSSPSLLGFVDVSLLTLSFLMLLAFGLRMIFVYRYDDGRNRTIFFIAGFAVTYGISTAVMLVRHQPCREECTIVADVLSRYILGIPGALLAAWALLLQRQAFRERGMVRCAKDIRWAAGALILYGVVGQFFTKPSFLFPSTIINSNLFLQLFGFPVQIFRAVLASAIAVFVIRAMRAFELERQNQLSMAQEARLVAQQEALVTQRRAQMDTEKLNQELQTAVQDLTMLFELSRSLASTLNRETLLKRALAQVFESVPRINGGMIFLQDKPGRPLSMMVQVGYSSNGESGSLVMKRQAQAVGEYVVNFGQAAGWSGHVIVPLNELATYTEQGAAESGAFVLGLPLFVQDQVAGSLVLSINPQTTSFTHRDLSLIKTVAGQLSLAIENATLYQEVHAREERRGELLHQVVSAQETERQRIARELHDGAGQMLTALGLGLAAASDSINNDPERGIQQLAELKTMSNQVMNELQNLVAGLRPSVLDDLGLVPALRGLVKDFENRTGLAASLEVKGSPRRGYPELETVMFRITQETLTNVAKHANANLVEVTLIYQDQDVALLVKDDGRGFDPDEVLRLDPRHQWGLLGIEERVALVGGTFVIESQPGLGTTIRVEIPFRGEPIHAFN